jgi:osmotically-inducible protein OsmY
MNMQTVWTMGAALVLGAVVMAAPMPAQAIKTDDQPMKDSWLTSKTKIALFADGRVKGRQVNVETQQAR